MKTIGHLCLLAALVTSGCVAISLLAYRTRATRALLRATNACGIVALFSLTAALGIVAWPLVVRDFSCDYVTPYSSWSILLWAWALAGVSVVFRHWRTSDAGLRDCAFGVLMAHLALITAVLVFAADPFESRMMTLTEADRPYVIQQYSSMSVSAPVVVCAYAAWSVPFALTVAAVLLGKRDAAWTQVAQPWAALAWSLLLIVFLLNPDRASQGNAIKNGGLLPWLTGTAFIVGMTAWRTGNCLKKTTVAFGIVTVGLCHFASFLASGDVFVRIHDFAQSHSGAEFLGVTAVVIAGGAAVLTWSGHALRPERAAGSILARENLTLVTMILLVALALVFLVRLVVAPLSEILLSRTITIGSPKYTDVVITVGFLLLAITAAVPLLRWGGPPDRPQRRVIGIALAVGKVAASLGALAGLRQFAAVWAAGFATVALTAFVGAIVLELRHSESRLALLRLGPSARDICRRFAGHGVCLGVVVLLIGITGSAIGTQRHDIGLAKSDVLPTVPLQRFGAVITAGCSLVWFAARRRSVRTAEHDDTQPDQSDIIRRLAA